MKDITIIKRSYNKKDMQMNNNSGNKTAIAYSVMNEIVYFIFGLISLLLFIRFIFKMTGANQASIIVSGIYELTNIFMTPFRFIFPTSQASGAVFEWSVLVAIVFYLLLSWILTYVTSMVYMAGKVIE